MAIENQTETTPTDVETNELLQTIDTVQESANFEVMPDGSAPFRPKQDKKKQLELLAKLKKKFPGSNDID